jgi:hypothetical protein
MKALSVANKLKDKDAGLRVFRDRGFILVDASYEPVNHLKGKARDKKILDSFSDLIRDLASLDAGKNAALILVKSNICRLMEPRLKREGFSVRNAGLVIPFPGSGRQAEFQAKLVPLLGEIGG